MYRTLPPDPTDCDRSGSGGSINSLISVDTAVARGLSLVEPSRAAETLPLEQALGRVLAAPALASIPLPPFDNSAMDGYAVRTADLTGDGPWHLPVTGRIAAGDSGGIAAGRGDAIRILTGAQVPPDLDAVVMQEHVTTGDGKITLQTRPRTGQNIRRKGEDLPKGDQILPGGVVIEAREAAALAAVGMAHVQVRPKLRVSMFCTGTELRQPGESLRPGQIWNSNRFALLGALSENWIATSDLGAVPDDPTALTAALVSAADTSDVIVSTGGVSVGEEDHMPRLLREAGGEIHAMHIAMKPGKPLVVGKIGRAVYIGLPGNPVAAFITWMVVGARLARTAAGIAPETTPRPIVRADFNLDRRTGRCEYRPVRIVGRNADGTLVVDLLSESYSARIAMLAAADGLALLPAHSQRIRRGDVLEFHCF